MKVHYGKKVTDQIIEAIGEKSARGWVPAVPVLGAVESCIPPELAIKKWLGNTHGKRRIMPGRVEDINEEDVHDRVAVARAYYIKNLLAAMRRNGLVEFRDRMKDGIPRHMLWSYRDLRLTKKGRLRLKKLLLEAAK